MKKIKNNTKGITLVALVVTIIIMLILAGITIANIGGENSLINKSKKAKKEHEIAQAQELLSTELSSILAGNQGTKNLKDLDNLTVSGYTTKVSDIARLITMTKNNETFYFLVDSDYNILNLNTSNNSSQGSTGGNTQSGSSTSELINDFNIKIEEQNGLNAKINIDGTITTTDNSSISGYIILLDGNVAKINASLPYNLALDKANTTYKIDVLAIDNHGKTKNAGSSLSVTTPSLIVTTLDYPIFTSKGMVNVKYTNPSDSNDFYYDLDLTRDCTAEDALDKAAYDGDDSTYYDGTSQKCKFYYGKDTDIYQTCFNIDPTFKGTLVLWLSSSGYWNVPSDGKFLSTNIFHITYYGKNYTWSYDVLAKITGKLYEIYYDGNIE